jgi:signal transduction histidine kinase
VLVLFPYLLYRFMRTFSARTGWPDPVIPVLTVGLVAWSLALPELPEEGEPRPTWFLVYLSLFLAHWTLLTVVVSVRLWLAGRGQPSVASKRMRMLAAASASITVAILFAGFGASEGSVLDAATSSLVFLSAVGFLVGLTPPTFVRVAWRQPAQERFREAVAQLIRATTPEQVAAEVLPGMAALVGARGVALLDDKGHVLGAHGASDAMIDRLDDDALRLDAAGGSLVVWTNPYAPFFGDEELGLLESLASLTGLALDRARLFAHERDAREALERADEVKTRFVALAAHELRAPVAGIHGTVETLDGLADRLTDEQRGDLRQLLRSQTERLRLLIEQLLDLTRLEAEVVAIRPERFSVRPRIESLAEGVAGREGGIRIDVDPELEAVADPEAFDRVLSNLLVNAIRHGEPPVVVTAELRDRHFRVAVEDRGRGVPPAFVPELFERFSRSAISEEATEGTGLGLAIARSYAQAHGGDLLYQPAQPTGARFELVLPRTANANGKG